MLVMFMAPKRKSTLAQNPLRFDASSSTDYSPSFGSMMMMPLRHFRRTSLDEAFIRNANSFCQTLPTLTFPLSFTVGDRSHCVTSLVLIQEFYSNMHGIDHSVPLFFTRVRGTRIPVTQ